ncbi:hypothetical protein YC2023_030732 [Brassica napus]
MSDVMKVKLIDYKRSSVGMEQHLTAGLDRVRTSRLPQKEKPQLNRETEPGNFGFPDDLLFMIRFNQEQLAGDLQS